MPENVILKTELSTLKLLKRGKVRDIYDLDAQLLIISTDRISAFDVILPNGIPEKGEILTAMSSYWFKIMEDIIPNHVIASNCRDFPEPLRQYCDVLKGRSMLVKKAKPLPVECIVRGYISGSGWNEYKEKGSVCGIKLPDGLLEGSELPEPLFTPSTKADEGHDENITFDEMKKLIEPKLADEMKAKSIAIYKRARDIARNKGIIIADTKFEFGIYDNKLLLIDEILTPDSSRFWPISDYKPGQMKDISLDKQFIRNYLISINWDKKPPAPALPAQVILNTTMRYKEALNRLIGSM
ncbi:MAG: phosphoribosylaminoimidazolesuccinocarboxamide synthase [Deltaproteobacteria bacterium]|nr:phosphoribosylaminoimidazolesuccinocarboxamide synthase [Deltaproteobacteria bacterium]